MRPIDPLTLGIIEGSIPLMRHHLTFLFILVLVAASLLAYVISLPDARNESREIHTVRLEDHSGLSGAANVPADYPREAKKSVFYP